MVEFDPVQYKKMVKNYQEKDDPTGWFESIYKNVNGNYKDVFWADLEPNPYLIEYIKNNPINNAKSKKAIVVGCGVGDDCEFLSNNGYEVIGFDISSSAIQLCKNRYPNSKVTYLVADLFKYPKNWFENFDLIYECNTIQVLPGKYRIEARDAIASLASKNGLIIVSCRSRISGEQEDDIPLPLDKNEIDGFKLCGFTEASFLKYDDNQKPSVPHFFAIYKKF
jgi:2-polyprenyl-3-methyl-5-hydroxy-6-metoxy-1,4-benzoquinol methylase